MIKNFKELINKIKEKEPRTVVVIKAEDKEILKAAIGAEKEGIARFVLIGEEEKIRDLGKELGNNLSNFNILNYKEEKKALIEGLRLIRSGTAHILMKGKISTSALLKGVLNKETGLRGKRILSHCMVAKIPSYDKFIFVTDGGMNLNPDLKMKIDIVNNTVEFARKFGIEKPKVAALSAVETVNPDLPETIDGATLSKMSQRGQIKNCIIDGPISLDLAFSKQSARIKGIKSPIAGDSDIFLVPGITAGNILGKSIIYIAQQEAGGIILGAKAPVVMLSRSDDAALRINSIALGVLLMLEE